MYWIDKLKWWKKKRWNVEIKLTIHNPTGPYKQYVKLDSGDTLNIVDEMSPCPGLTIHLLEDNKMTIDVYTELVRKAYKEK